MTYNYHECRIPWCGVSFLPFVRCCLCALPNDLSHALNTLVFSRKTSRLSFSMLPPFLSSCSPITGPSPCFRNHCQQCRHFINHPSNFLTSLPYFSSAIFISSTISSSSPPPPHLLQFSSLDESYDPSLAISPHTASLLPHSPSSSLPLSARQIYPAPPPRHHSSPFIPLYTSPPIVPPPLSYPTHPSPISPTDRTQTLTCHGEIHATFGPRGCLRGHGIRAGMDEAESCQEKEDISWERSHLREVQMKVNGRDAEQSSVRECGGY
jgi:hypothetical protein